jgi:hypothetical protein
LDSGKPRWCVDMEPVGQSFRIATIRLASIVMRSHGTGAVEEIHAIGDKSTVVGDHDGNGIDDITACFRTEDLRVLFSDLRGSTSVAVTLEGQLFTGGTFRAPMNVLVAAGKGNLAASIYPNPLNPEAMLSFVTTRAGFARVRLYNLDGRSVRALLDESVLPAGIHVLRIDGRGGDGRSLASGIYYFQIEAAEGTGHGRFIVLK